jgi:hypothetical protein
MGATAERGFALEVESEGVAPASACKAGSALGGPAALASVIGNRKRLASPASRDNPAVGLTHAEHAEVGRQQCAAGLFDRNKLAGMTAEQIIDANATAMQRAGIPQDVIETLRKEALRHAATLTY